MRPLAPALSAFPAIAILPKKAPSALRLDVCTNPGAQMQQPLAIMGIGGMTANMLFTRLVISAGYLLMERRTPVKA